MGVYTLEEEPTAYWTSTANSSSAQLNLAYYVSYEGTVKFTDSAVINAYGGVRPVIELYK